MPLTAPGELGVGDSAKTNVDALESLFEAPAFEQPCELPKDKRGCGGDRAAVVKSTWFCPRCSKNVSVIYCMPCFDSFLFDMGGRRLEYRTAKHTVCGYNDMPCIKVVGIK